MAYGEFRRVWSRHNVAPPFNFSFFFFQICIDPINRPLGILPVRKSVPGTDNFNACSYFYYVDNLDWTRRSGSSNSKINTSFSSFPTHITHISMRVLQSWCLFTFVCSSVSVALLTTGSCQEVVTSI